MNKQQLENVFERRIFETGDNYKLNCPFHDERTPSFYVHRTEYIAHCFGCGVAGGIDVLTASYLGVSVQEARETLGITVRDRVDKRFRQRREGTKSVRTIPESWLAPFERKVHKYVLGRGFDISTLAAAGALYDNNLKRQVFPSRERDGRLMGAVGRACGDFQPKWHFYWKYDKGSTLYTPFRLEPLRPTLVVEGVFDLLWVYQHIGDSYVNLTAPIGASLTNTQVRTINSISSDVILGLDNDEAGQLGTERARQAFKKTSRVRNIVWPKDAKDWMDLDKEQILDAIRQARNSVQCKLQR